LPTLLLPFCKVHIAKFSTQHSQVANATWLFCSLAILSNCPAYFTLWAAQNWGCPQISKFLGCPRPECFSSLPKPLLQKFRLPCSPPPRLSRHPSFSLSHF
jgi:hypothetical protein